MVVAASGDVSVSTFCQTSEQLKVGGREPGGQEGSAEPLQHVVTQPGMLLRGDSYRSPKTWPNPSTGLEASRHRVSTPNGRKPTTLS